MMTSINPKNINNFNSNKGDIIPSTVNNLFQRNNYGLEKEEINREIDNNIKYNSKSNRDINMNDKYKPPQLKSFRNISNAEINPENIYKNMSNNYEKLNINNNIPNNLNNLNYNYNSSINLNLGLQAKKNYSTPILNEGPPGTNQDVNYNKSFDMYERNQQNKNMLNFGKSDNLAQNKNEGNDEFYLAEIDKLKKEINNLKKNNEYLNNQLKEEQKKNEQLFSIQKAKDENENSILAEISHCLQVASFDEILPKLNEVINYLNNNVNNNSQKNKANDGNNKIRDELISKLQNLYLSLTGSDEKKEEVTIKILWRWIKHLINTVKQLALEKEQNIENYQKMQEIGEYKEYCDELISVFNLQNLDELKLFMEENFFKQINKDNQQEMRNMANMQNGPRQQYQGQEQNYPPEEENEEVEVEGEEGIDEEGDNEGDADGDNENMEPNQQQYDNENENENEYEENNEIMDEQMQMNEQNNQNDDNYNFNKYGGN